MKCLGESCVSSCKRESCVGLPSKGGILTNLSAGQQTAQVDSSLITRERRPSMQAVQTRRPCMYFQRSPKEQELESRRVSLLPSPPASITHCPICFPFAWLSASILKVLLPCFFKVIKCAECDYLPCLAFLCLVTARF